MGPTPREVTLAAGPRVGLSVIGRPDGSQYLVEGIGQFGVLLANMVPRRGIELDPAPIRVLDLGENFAWLQLARCSGTPSIAKARSVLSCPSTAYEFPETTLYFFPGLGRRPGNSPEEREE